MDSCAFWRLRLLPVPTMSWKKLPGMADITELFPVLCEIYAFGSRNCPFHQEQNKAVFQISNFDRSIYSEVVTIIRTLQRAKFCGTLFSS